MGEIWGWQGDAAPGAALDTPGVCAATTAPGAQDASTHTVSQLQPNLSRGHLNTAAIRYLRNERSTHTRRDVLELLF